MVNNKEKMSFILNEWTGNHSWEIQRIKKTKNTVEFTELNIKISKKYI